MLEFWFEFASTYSYVAAMQIEEACRRRGVGLRWKAFMLGPVFELQGWNDSPFNLNPRRGAYMWRDMERLTAKLGLPWRKPSVFPRNSTLAARVAAAFEDEPWIGQYVRGVFTANFGRDRAIEERSTIASVLESIGQPEALIDRAASEPLRSALRANTNAAIALGIFGAPNCVVGGELFWGEEALGDAVELAASQNDGSERCAGHGRVVT